MNKASIGNGIGVLLVLAGLGYFVSQNIDGAVKELIETIGNETIGTEVSVADVKLSLSDGTGVVSGMTVANPESFSPGPLFSIDSIMIDIDPASLTEDVYVIESISVHGANVLAEQVGDGTNIQSLMNGMEPSAEDGEGASGGSDADEVRLVVQEIAFTKGNIQLKSDVFGERTLALPDFTVRNLGSREEGLTPDELGRAVAWEMVGQVKVSVVEELQGLAIEAAREKLKEKIDKKLGEGIDKLKDLFGGDS